MKSNWTSKPPTKPGKYWTRLGESEQEYAVVVCGSPRRLMVICRAADEIASISIVAKDKGREWRKRR